MKIDPDLYSGYLRADKSIITVDPRELENYLADREKLSLSFKAVDVSRGNGEDDNESFSASSDYRFGATDRRIVYLDDESSFKDIDYQHISSIETSTEEEPEFDGGMLVGICGGVLALGGIVSLSSDPGVAILGLLIGVGMIALGASMFDGVETIEKQNIKFITGNERDQRIEVTLADDADENVGAELSSILRKQK